MPWFTRQKSSKDKASSEGERKVKTEGLWLKCDGCRQIVWKKALEENQNVCPRCSYHFRVDAASRLKQLFDGPYETFDAGLASSNPLAFVDSKPYTERLSSMEKATSLRDAVISAAGTLAGRPVYICAFELKFIGGSVGAAVGEKITRAIERSIAERKPLIIVSASGGMRMQEGAVSLMQMAKISAALMRLDEARLPYISVLTDPTTGGVTASFSTLGDVILAEPGALIGFAGAVVIKETTRQTLPVGFQRSEFLLKHGLIDQIVSRVEMRDRLRDILQALYVRKMPAAAETE